MAAGVLVRRSAESKGVVAGLGKDPGKIEKDGKYRRVSFEDAFVIHPAREGVFPFR